MKPQPKNNVIEETPHDMMKRIFAVAELICRADTCQSPSVSMKKHNLENVLYGKKRNRHSGNTDGKEET